MGLRSFIVFLFVINIYPSIVCGQIYEDFSDGDFSDNPSWTGSESLFIVENEVLRSNSPGQADYYLSTANAEIDDTEWSFDINLDFSTSGVNYVDVYLVADNSDLGQVQNGYFLRLGDTDDEISLYKTVAGAVTQLIDGEDGIVGSSVTNSFSIKVQRTATGEFSIAYAPNQTGIFSSGGNSIDTEILSTAFFGFYIVQSDAASPVNSHYFDNIAVGPIPVDTTAPEITAGVALSATELKITFSEPLNPATAENLDNYTLLNSISAIVDAQLSTTLSTEVILTVGTPLSNGVEIELSVANVEDLSGNAMPQQIVIILYFVPDDAVYKEVVFNEIMADPTPQIGLPDAEFIEIFNASDSKIFDFQGWIFVNSTTQKTLESAVLLPGDFLILCDESDTALFSPYGAVLGIGSFTAISNEGDSLTLLNPEGEMIDLVSFTDDWYKDATKNQGGYTLELINPFTECSGAANWQASSSSTGGTPNTQNSVYDETPDTSPPVVASFSVLSPQLVRIYFNETMDEATLQNGSFTWSNGITTTSVSPAANLMSVGITLDAPLDIGVEYTLAINGVTDCIGNEILANSTVTILLGVQPEANDLLISEIMVDPTPSNGLPEGEYFELYNASNKVLDIVGIRLNDKVFEESRILYPGDYILCIDASLASAFLVYPDAYLLANLGTTYFTNGGRDLTLYNGADHLLDRANYSIEWYRDSEKAEGGYSLERMNLSEPCRGRYNWTASPDPSGGTPGVQNAAFTTEPDQVSPHFLTIFVTDSTHLELIFSEAIDSLSILTASFEINPEIGIVSINNSPPNYTGVFIELANPLAEGTIYEMIISGISDCIGNEMTEMESLPFALPQAGLPGDILINEILFNPNTGGADYVEIVNVSEKVVGLQNWVLQNQALSTAVISKKPRVIFPGAYMLFTADPAGIAQEYPFGNPENFIKIEDLPAYSNSDGAVIIANQDNEVIDRFDYKEEYHFSLLTSFKGVSLERVSFTRPTQDPGNWTSAAENADFGTPGKINSQYSPQGMASTNFELENEIFSPDNDGFQDLLNINYKLTSPGYVATLKVFDRSGRPVANIVNNELLATEGTLTWDGVIDAGTKARIGPHILLIQVFNLDGETKVIKIPFIVAGKLSD